MIRRHYAPDGEPRYWDTHGHAGEINLDAVLPDTPRHTCGDSAYSGNKPEAAIRARGGRPQVVHTGTWGGVEALERLQAHNAEI